ncbi:hypothetical protein NIASO_01660 [Niabella soli DSM 19437]|uniref:Uncharacterized protein n=1 Tax=Niabella soli DSM 19437 TaxID=929713 RepID=W0F6K7_9BACT|nr:hypothetical protein NIASO_01660 [Niabella soli DSM 19437]
MAPAGNGLSSKEKDISPFKLNKMKKLVAGISLALMLMSAALYANNNAPKKADCCAPGKACCYPGSSCCRK